MDRSAAREVAAHISRLEGMEGRAMTWDVGLAKRFPDEGFTPGPEGSAP
jgi:hypothetical protein